MLTGPCALGLRISDYAYNFWLHDNTMRFKIFMTIEEYFDWSCDKFFSQELEECPSGGSPASALLCLQQHEREFPAVQILHIVCGMELTNTSCFPTS